jgi:predicted MFS family arabinose efflux permease
MVVGAGGALGAALGGFMAEALGWRWEFGVQVPFQLLVTVLAVFAIPDGIGAQGGKSVWDALRSFDVKGSALLTTSLAFLIMGINIGGNNLPCK